MGRKSRAKRERRAQRLATRRTLPALPTTSDSLEQVAYCPACSSITVGMLVSGLSDRPIFDLPSTCPTCGRPTEIISWDEWQSRGAVAAPAAPPPPPAV